MSELCIYGNPTLRLKAEPITEFDANLQKFAEHLVDMMYKYDGIGLASPQIGKSVRAIAVDISEAGDNPLVLINPEITWSSEEIESDNEGCLSVPAIRGNVERPISVTVKAFDVDGNEVLFEKTEGLFARVLQHEMDHLDGIMFVDKVSPVKKRLIASKLKKMAREAKRQ